MPASKVVDFVTAWMESGVKWVGKPASFMVSFNQLRRRSADRFWCGGRADRAINMACGGLKCFVSLRYQNMPRLDTTPDPLAVWVSLILFISSFFNVDCCQNHDYRPFWIFRNIKLRMPKFAPNRMPVSNQSLYISMLVSYYPSVSKTVHPKVAGVSGTVPSLRLPLFLEILPWHRSAPLQAFHECLDFFELTKWNTPDQRSAIRYGCAQIRNRSGGQGSRFCCMC